tara:strand:+ start:843 stop:1259 length:417 start_codon:yes stop_codon:yes gene_type:complete
MNDLITNGEAKTDVSDLAPNDASIDRYQHKISSFISKLIDQHIKRALDNLKMGEPIDITPERLTHLETAIDEIKADLDNMFQLSADTVNDIVTERLDERDGERNNAEDASEYVKIEDLADAIRDCFYNGEVTFNVDVS